MRKGFLISGLVALVLMIAGIAAAITTKTAKPGQPMYADGVVVQNNTATAPKAAGAVCVTKVLTHGGTIATFNLYTSNSWYSKADWTVTNSSGVAVVVKRSLGSNTAYMPGSSGSIAVNREYASYKLATFSNASTAAANASYTACQDRQ